MYKLCLAALVAFAVPSMAMAGGGNTKTKGSIEFINNTNFTVLVAVDPSDALIAATSAEEFRRLGGQILNGGQRFEFKNLKAGNHSVAAAYADVATSPEDFESTTLKVNNGQKRVIRTQDLLGSLIAE